VGREVVRGLVSEGIATVFTHHRSAEVARALAEETGQRTVQLDLADTGGVRAAVRALVQGDQTPDIFVQCAGAIDGVPFCELDDATMDHLVAVNCRSTFAAVQELAPHLVARGGGDVVLVGGLDRAQSLPLPVGFAATQGMLAALVMALGRELGPSGVRVNMVALGPLDGGLSRSLTPKLHEDYLRFSALRRLGTPAEAARAIVWLATRNGYMNGKVLPLNGGI